MMIRKQCTSGQHGLNRLLQSGLKRRGMNRCGMNRCGMNRCDLNRRARHGLAPLEMVLVLLPLMLVMSIIMVYGFGTVWKLRGETVSRDMAWRSRVSHSFPAADWTVEEWPENISLSNTQLLQELDDPVLNDPIIAGEIPEVTVNPNTLDLSRSVIRGNADLNRTTTILPAVGNLSFQVDHDLVDSRFQAFWSNSSRRFPQIYTVDLDFVQTSDEYLQNLTALIEDPDLARLEPLDDDREYERPSWWKDEVWDSDIGAWVSFPWNRSPPFFYPRDIRPPNYPVITFEWLDRNTIELVYVTGMGGQSGHAGRVRGIPASMVNSTISLYQAMRRHPCIPASLDSQLERKIEALGDFLDKLRDEGF